MNNDIKRFTVRFLVFGSPFICLLVHYFITDPFQVVYTYDSYPTSFGKSLNRNRVSTQMYFNGKDAYNYQSFIFGSSRSSVFYTQDWAKHINDTLAFHFDASNETISGIANKVKFLDKQGVKIKHALLVLDEGNFEYAVDTAGTIFIQDYRVAENINPIRYHLVFFNSFFADAFFLKYIDFSLFGKFRSYMNGVFEFRRIDYTPINNDFIFSSYIEAIKKDSVGFYKSNSFFDRTNNPFTQKPIIKPYQEQYLKEIADVLNKNKTDYHLIISPSYAQIKLDKKDSLILANYFDPRRIHDYSGKNELTNRISNYYEIFHFKPSVARTIMDEIYQ